jgi:hypothetical protein
MDVSSGTTVTLQAVPGTSSAFEAWSGCDSVTGNACIVTMTSAKSVSAAFSTNISSQVSVTSSGLVYSRATKIYSGTLTITNTGATTINGTIAAILNNLSTGVTLTNATGMNNGFPYIGSVVSLSPGASTTLPLKISNPTNQPIHYVPVTTLQ